MKKDTQEVKKMDTETAILISRAFKKCWDETINLIEVKRMVLIPSVEIGGKETAEEEVSEIYGVCLRKKKREMMYVAKIERNEEGKIEKIYVAVHPPIREAAKVWCEEKKNNF